MNIMNRLTLRQLKMNKKRTLVTIIGTIISAAMITAVATLGLSFMDLMQRHSIERSGEWHVKYTDVNQKQLRAIKEDGSTKTSMMSRELGYAYLKNSENQNKPYLYVMEYSNTAFSNFPVELAEGRFPEQPDEIVINEAIRTNGRVALQIGDTLDLTIGERYPVEYEEGQKPLGQSISLVWEDNEVAEYLTKEMEKTYTVVGIMKAPDWEYTWSPGYTVLSYIDENVVSDGESFDVSVILKKVDHQLFPHAEKLAEDNQIEVYGFNNDLLRYYGVVKDDAARKMIYMLTSIIMIIIVIGSVSLIYNAFAISVSERSRYLGMLASVGATKRQKRNSVFFEGTVIGSISIPIGITAGLLGLGITYSCINPMLKDALQLGQGLRLQFYPSSILGSILISAGTILISTFLPARRASNISAIDAIRQTNEVKISQKHVRTFGLTKKIFGMEGDLGLKNLKRNRGRYKATVFSLIISMVLFLVVSFFTQYLKKSMVMAQDGINFDVQATIHTNDSVRKEEIYQKLKSVSDYREVSRLDYIYVTTYLEEEAIADHLKEYKEDLMVNGKYRYDVMLNVLDDISYDKYCKEIGLSDSHLKISGQSPAIIIDTVNYKDYAADKYVETKAVKTNIGDTMELRINDGDDDESIQKQITVAALTKHLPTGIMSSGGGANFHAIVSQKVFEQMLEGEEDDVRDGIMTQAFYHSDNPLKLQEELETIQNSVGASDLSIYNVYLYRQREEQMILLISIFTYAFIILITAICVANILNTISTSIALRKREFAMLKSVGITPIGFNKMLNFESIFYGLKALLYGLPISVVVMNLIYHVLGLSFEYEFEISSADIIIVIISVFLIVGVSMLYSSKKVKKENIIDALKQEII